MKIRIKKTGQILLDVKYIDMSSDTIKLHYLDDDVLRDCQIKNLSDIEEVKDDEEPKKYWYISPNGLVVSFYEEYESAEDTKVSKEIGNYFETPEEAKQAVEKLKAWKRLKDEGFRLEGWTIDDGLRVSICTNFDSDGIYDEHRKELKKDLDTCFGGKE